MLGYSIQDTFNPNGLEYAILIYGDHIHVYTYYRLNTNSNITSKQHFDSVMRELNNMDIASEAYIYSREKNPEYEKKYLIDGTFSTTFEKQFSTLHYVLLNPSPSIAMYIGDPTRIIVNGVLQPLPGIKVKTFRNTRFYFIKKSTGLKDEPSSFCSYTATTTNYTSHYAIQVFNNLSQVVFDGVYTSQDGNQNSYVFNLIQGFKNKCNGIAYDYTDCSITGHYSNISGSSYSIVYIYNEDGYFIESTSYIGSASTTLDYLNERIDYHKNLCKNKNKIPTDCCILVCCEPDKYILKT